MLGRGRASDFDLKMGWVYNYVNITMLINTPGRKLIKELVEEKYYSPSGDTYLLSLYINTHSKARSDVFTVLSSYIDSAFKGKKEKGSLVLEVIEKKLSKFKSFNRGLAIFVKFSFRDNKVDIKVFDSPLQFDNEVFLGKVYMVGQLVSVFDRISTSLIINLDRKEATLCELRDGKFTVLESFKNKYIKSENPRYLEKYGPTGNHNVFHGTGDLGLQREERDIDKKFFFDIYESLKEKFENLKEYEYFLLLHSSSYAFFVEKMRETIENDYDVEVVFESLQVDGEEDLTREVSSRVSVLRDEFKMEHFKLSSSTPTLFAKGWKEVADASRFRKIDTLYIKKGEGNKGYIVHDNLIYTYPVKDSEQVEDISPWLVKNVLENSGQVFVFDENPHLKDGVSARLRF